MMLLSGEDVPVFMLHVREPGSEPLLPGQVWRAPRAAGPAPLGLKSTISNLPLLHLGVRSGPQDEMGAQNFHTLCGPLNVLL